MGTIQNPRSEATCTCDTYVNYHRQQQSTQYSLKLFHLPCLLKLLNYYECLLEQNYGNFHLHHTNLSQFLHRRHIYSAFDLCAGLIADCVLMITYPNVQGKTQTAWRLSRATQLARWSAHSNVPAIHQFVSARQTQMRTWSLGTQTTSFYTNYTKWTKHFSDNCSFYPKVNRFSNRGDVLLSTQ